MSGIVFGNLQTLCSQRVWAVVEQLGLTDSITFQNLDVFKGEHKQEPYKSRHPFGRVPAYESKSGLRLFESRAIARYIDGQAGGKLTRKSDADQAALVDVWATVEQAYFDKPAYGICNELVFKQLFGLEADLEVVKKERAAIIPVLDAYDKRLGTQKYLVDDTLSIADLFHLPFGEKLFKAQPDLLEGRPNLTRWWNDVSSLPSWQATKKLGQF